MANSRQIIAMIRSHANGDGDQFLSVVEHIANDAERNGQNKVASEIKGIVHAIRQRAEKQKSAKLIPIAAPRGELAGLVRVSYPSVRLGDLVLGRDLHRRITRLVREHRETDVLQARGLTPRRKFLFSGPPGTGKGMTAHAIAGELGLPLFSILLDGVITKFMGETAAKMRLIFDAMQTTTGVYFFDEVDALAARRGAENDIGEARRVLNSFLQFLEEDQSGSVVIAATNHRALLDPAIFRRFDTAFTYEKPSASEARQLLTNRLAQFDLQNIQWQDVEPALSGLSQADIVAAADDAARDAVLDNAGNMSLIILQRSLKDRAQLHSD